MIRRYWKKILLGLFAAAVLIATLGVPYAFARLVTRAGTRPQDRALTTSPSDHGVDFEDVRFSSADGTTLAGWYCDAPDADVAIAVGHGLFRSRREVLDRAAFFRKSGFDTLLFDFRRHGESEGERVTLGYDERHDFRGAVRFLRERNPESQIVLYGVSMGAAASLLAARDTHEVAAVIADSSFLSVEHTVAHHAKLIFGLPRFPFASSLLWFLELEAGFDHADFDLERAAAASGDRPILVIAGGDDQRMPPSFQKRIFEASSSAASMFHVFPDAGHGRAYQADPKAYEELVLGFLEAAGIVF